MNVKVKCMDTNEIKVEITAEATLGQWKELVERITASAREGMPITYYAPLWELLLGINAAVNSVQKREEIDAGKAPHLSVADLNAEEWDATIKTAMASFDAAKVGMKPASNEDNVQRGWWCHQCSRIVHQFSACPRCFTNPPLTGTDQAGQAKQAVVQRCDRCGREYLGTFCASCHAAGQANQGLKAG